MKPKIANKVISMDNKRGRSNKQTSSEILMQERKCQMKSKTRKRKIEAIPHKHCSYSLSQPIISPNSTSTRHMLRNWQPPLKMFRHNQNTNSIAENFIPDTMPSTSFGSGEEVNGNTEIATENTAAAAEDGQTDHETNSCNDENQEDISVSQQPTQEYVLKETAGNTTEMEDGKYEEPEIDETNTEKSCATQEGEESKPEDNSDQMAQSLHNTSNKGASPVNVSVTTDRNGCNRSFIEHSEEKTDQSCVSTKHTENNDIPSATTVDLGKEKDKEDSKLNIMGKADNIISASGTNFLVTINESSHYKEQEKTKPSYDTVMCQIQSLTVKYPQHMRSIRTLIGSDEDSPLPLDLFFSDSQLPWNTTGEMEQLAEIQTISQETTHKITEQKTGENQCEEKGSLSGQVLTSQAKADKTNDSSLIKEEDLQTICNFQDKPQKEHEESTFMPSLVTTDILLNKSDVRLDKMMQNLTMPALEAAKPSDICNVQSTKSQGYTGHANMVTVTPTRTVESTESQQGMEQADTETVTPICTMQSTKLQHGTEQADLDTVRPISTVESTKLWPGMVHEDTETVTLICTVGSTKLQPGTQQADMETVIPTCTVGSTKLQPGTHQADMQTVIPICTVGSSKLQPGTHHADMQTVIPICTVQSTKIRPGTHHADMETVIPICSVESTKLQPGTQQADMETVIPICTVQSTKLQRSTEQADSETVTPVHTVESTKSRHGMEQTDQKTATSVSLPDHYPKLNIQSEPTKMTTNTSELKEVQNVETASPMPEDNLAKIKDLLVPPATAGNKCTEEHMIKNYKEASSDTASYSTVTTMIETGQPESDHTKSNENGSKCPLTTLTEGMQDGKQAGNTGPLHVTHQSPIKKKYLPKQNEIHQPNIGFRMSKDTFPKFPMALETSNVGSCPTSSPNKIELPGTDNNCITENCSEQPAKSAEGIKDTAKTGNTEPVNTSHPSANITKTRNMEPLRTVHLSTPKRQEFHPQQEAINQSTIGFDNSKNIFCKSPTAAMEAPNYLGQLGDDPLTSEYKHDTASHGYLLDDDIGLTGSQLLHIEDQCQYGIQSTEEERNHDSRCGEARVPDTDMLPTPMWVQNMQQKRQKLRSIIGDISRLK
jgi:hypothetical protein